MSGTDDVESDLGPSPPDPSAASGDLRLAFWSLVMTFNAALLATALGAMLVGFRGRYQLGGALLLGGLVLFALGYRRYRRVRYGDG